MRRLGILALIVAMNLPGPAPACRLALALALDVSGSVDSEEYRLQMSGLANALGDPDVEAALFSIPDAPVALAVYEWSSSRYQLVIQDWILIDSKAVLEGVRARLSNWPRGKAPEATGLGAALEYGKTMLDLAPPCWNQTLDVSGDGKNNDWPDPRLLRRNGALAGIRINGLVVAQDAGASGGQRQIEAAELSAYFKARVIQGPDAFVEVALGFEDYSAAMRRKLLRELKAMPVAALPDNSEMYIAPAELRVASQGQ